MDIFEAAGFDPDEAAGLWKIVGKFNRAELGVGADDLIQVLNVNKIHFEAEAAVTWLGEALKSVRVGDNLKDEARLRSKADRDRKRKTMMKRQRRK